MKTEQKEEVHLLKKWQKGFWNLLFSRMLLIIVLLLIQVGLLLSAFAWLEEFLPHIIGGQFLLTAVMMLHLINSRLDATAKITWLVVIMMAPVFGSGLYLFTLREIGHRALRKRVGSVSRETRQLLQQSEAVKQAVQDKSFGVSAMAEYIYRVGGYPVCSKTEVTYFPSGEEKFQRLLTELEQAKDFIFLEYFIIEEGVMWGRILEILARKAAQGVDVRILYDGICEFLLLPRGYARKLAALGIRCKVFSPFIPMVSTYYNFRDHRKILVIDGHTAFNGGINLADEYINVNSKFGHWKDTAVMLKGEAVKNLTVMFLQNWALDEKQMDYQRYLPATQSSIPAAGYVLPYGDCPLDAHRVGQRVYLDILNRAKHYVHIMTPYLILDGEMENALKYAAQRGVQVQLILPGIPDKQLPYALAKTHYPTLLDSGVEIYEYTPGFVHAKVFVCDDEEAVVGTINLDYRSLYHHFECATYLYGVPCIQSVAQDFQNTLQCCRRAGYDTLKKEKWSRKAAGYLFKLFGPFL